jgi:antitoxin ParD1/3/4
MQECPVAKISISMSDAMEEFVAGRVESGEYNNTSEYFRDLVRRDQEKKVAEAQLRTLIQRAIKSGISKKTPREIWAAAEERHERKQRGK